MRLRTLAVLVVTSVVAVGAAVAWAATQPSEAVMSAQIPVGADSAGNMWKLGGFSGLYPLDNSGRRFLTVTDRGPNADVNASCAPGGKEIYVPGYTPRILSLTVDGTTLKVDKSVPLSVGTQLASGLANLAGDEDSFAPPPSCKRLALDTYGVDTEGIVIDPRGSKKRNDDWDDESKRRSEGTFWLSDEYRPSVMQVAADGEILSRIVPGGVPGTNYATAVAQTEASSGNGLDVVQQFPEIVGLKFRKNRGFEDVALGTNKGRTYVYTSLQSPLENPDSSTRKSLAIRVFRIDVTKAKDPVVDREWLYVLEVKPDKKEPLADKISALWWVGHDKLLIEERNDDATNTPSSVTKIWLADLSSATNLLGGTWDQVSTSPSLEQKLVPATNGVVPAPPAGVTPVTKSLCANVVALLQAAGLVNQKIEGMAVTRKNGESTLTLLNDNDFDLEHVLNGGAAIPERVDQLPLPGTCG